MKIQKALDIVVGKIEERCNADDSATGVSTGYYDLDYLISDLKSGDLVVIGGRPSMGKTTLALNLVQNLVMQDRSKSVLIFSMEMSFDSIVMKMISSLGRIEYSKVRSGKLDEDDWARFGKAVSELSEVNITINDDPDLTIEVVSEYIKNHRDVSFIVIDYLQLMTSYCNDKAMDEELTRVIQELKKIARRSGITIIVLSQLNRELEKRPNKRPVLYDLRGSGSIEDVADTILFVYRDEVYYEDTPDRGEAEIIVAKQRSGETGSLRLMFHGEHCMFSGLPPDYY